MILMILNKKLCPCIFLLLIALSVYAGGTKEANPSNEPSVLKPDNEVIPSSRVESELPEQDTQLESSVEILDSSDQNMIEAEEQVYLSSKNKFRLAEYDGEVLDVTFNEDTGIKTQVLSSGTSVVVKNFDSLMRVMDIAFFTQNEKNNFLRKKITYLYEEKKFSPVESYEIDFVENTKIETLYNTDGFKISEKKFSGKYTLNLSSQVVEDVLLSQENFEYDDENRLTEHRKKTDDGLITTYFSYEKKFNKPDIRFFHDSVLREEIIYTEETSYTKITYFDNDQVVETLYVDGLKIEETYKSENKVLRRNQF